MVKITGFILPGVLLLLMVCAPMGLRRNCAYAQEKGPERWESAIRALEALDKVEKHPENAILFLGSSSVRRWDSIEKDMAPYPAIRRGYGGAKYSDLRVYAKRLTHPHKVRAIAIFVGNDVSGRATDRTPKQVVADVRGIIKAIREKFAATPIFFIAVTPTESRWRVWPQIQAVNAALAELCSDLPHVHWIATASHYLNEERLPRADLFVGDKLHLSEAGYDLWASIIKARLRAVLGKTR